MNNLFKILCGISLFLFMAVQGFAWETSESQNFEQLTVNGTSVSQLTASNLAQTSTQRSPCGALVTVETSALRFRTDGTNPTVSVGHLAAVNTSFVVDSLHDLARLRMIASVSTSSSTVFVTYWQGCR